MKAFFSLLQKVDYKGPVVAMSDNTKLKERLGYYARHGTIVGSTLSPAETVVETYDDICRITTRIKAEDAIATQVRAYILHVRPNL
jgi:hypothetical protein